MDEVEIDEVVIADKSKYKIEKAQWDNTEHECLIIDVLNEDTGEQFQYASRESDPAPLNQILWEQAMQNEDEIIPSEVELILSGEKEVPEGKTLIDMVLYDDAEQAIAVKATVTRLLSVLTSPENTALSRIDPVFEAKLIEAMRGLLNVEKQETFPYNIEWPEMPI